MFLLQLCDHAPKWLQGVAYHDGSLYLTSDDGDADAGEPDHMFRVIMSSDRSSGKVVPEKTFDDVTMQGEIEGLNFDEERGQFLPDFRDMLLYLEWRPLIAWRRNFPGSTVT